MNRWIMDIGCMFVCLILATGVWQNVQGNISGGPRIGAYLRALFFGKVFHPFSHNEYVPPFVRRSYRILVIPSTIILLIIWAMYITQLVRRMLGPVPTEDLYAQIMAAAFLGYMLYTSLLIIAFAIIWVVIAKKANNTIRGKENDEKHGRS